MWPESSRVPEAADNYPVSRRVSWFGQADRGKLGRMATDGSVTEFNADLSGDEHLKDVAVGPDGWVYYTVEHDGGMSKGRSSVLHSISRVNPAERDPGVGILTLGQSTPAGATERIHSRKTESPTRA